MSTSVDQSVSRRERSASARKIIGGMPDAAADQQRARPRGVGGEAVADRPEHTERSAHRLLRQGLETRADDLVENLDPAGPRVGAHDRQRPPHRHLCVAAQVREAPRHGRRGAPGRLQPDDELPPRILMLREQLGVFDEDGAAMSACRHPALRPASMLRTWTLRTIVASTAMRTATPFVTCCWIADCGAVGDIARDLDATIHRPGVHARSRPGAASASRSRVMPNSRKYASRVRDLRLGHALALDPQAHDRRRRPRCPPPVRRSASRPGTRPHRA